MSSDPLNSPGKQVLFSPPLTGKDTGNHDKIAANIHIELLEVGRRSVPSNAQHRAEGHTHKAKEPSSRPSPLLCHNLSPSPPLGTACSGERWCLGVRWPGHPHPRLHGRQRQPMLDEDGLTQSHCLGVGAGTQEPAFTAGDCPGREWLGCVPGCLGGMGASITLFHL